MADNRSISKIETSDGSPATLFASNPTSVLQKGRIPGRLVPRLHLLLSDGQAFAVITNPVAASDVEFISLSVLGEIVRDLDSIAETKVLDRYFVLPEAFLPILLNPLKRQYVKPYVVTILPALLVGFLASIALSWFLWRLVSEPTRDPLARSTAMTVACAVGLACMENWTVALRMLLYAAVTTTLSVVISFSDERASLWIVGGTLLGTMLSLTRSTVYSIKGLFRILAPGLVAGGVLLSSQLPPLLVPSSAAGAMTKLIENLTSIEVTSGAGLALLLVAAALVWLGKLILKDLTTTRLPTFWAPVKLTVLGYVAIAGVVGSLGSQLPKSIAEAFLVGAFLFLIWIVGRGDWKTAPSSNWVGVGGALSSGTFLWGSLFLSCSLLAAIPGADKKFSDWTLLIQGAGVSMLTTILVELSVRRRLSVLTRVNGKRAVRTMGAHG